MYRKFAHIDYVKSDNEIPLRINYLKKNPDAPLDWYVRKFNPFTASDIMIANESGYFVKLPITRAEADKDGDKAKTIIYNAINTLKEYNVDIVLPPKSMNLALNEKINIADGVFVFPYFAAEAAKKAFKHFCIQSKRTEILILSGRKKLTDYMIYNVSDKANFLTVLDGRNDLAVYDSLAARILDEYGLNIRISKYSKDAAKTADIIINLDDYKSSSVLDYSYKKNAVYFDLLTPDYERIERKRKRNDIHIIESIQINVFGERIPLPVFELAFYIKSKEYRQLCTSAFNTDVSDIVREQIAQMKASVSSLTETIQSKGIK